MAVEFVMPKLGLTMESGTVVSWLVDSGAEVAQGQAVLVIETDKVESEVEATGSGLLHHSAEVGQEYACGTHIGWFLAPGETPPAAAAAPAVAAAAVPVAAAAPPPVRAVAGAGGRLLASPNAKRLAAARGVDLWTVTGTGPGGRITSEDVPEHPAPVSTTAAIRPAAVTGVLATAAARTLADLLGVDVAQVAPAGTDPRVTREDVAAHVRSLLAATGERATPSTPSPALQEPSRVIPLTGMRGTIASRMSESIHAMAQLTLTMDVDMDRVVADRARRAEDAGPDGRPPGYTDYVIAATAAALTEHPEVNSQIVDGGVAWLPTVNVGLAVALDQGLIVPVIHDTPSRSLEELAAETARLATAARDGKLKLPELEGGTFSVTTLGMFDVDGFTPIINAPNTAILGVGRLRDDVGWSDDDKPVRVRRLTLSLTWDHRAFDGAPAAQFARTIKAKLESL